MAPCAMTLPPPGAAHITADVTPLHSLQRLASAVAISMTDRRQVAQERAARRVAEQANSAKSEFLSMVSHELRTPLNAILGYAQLLGMDEGLDARQRRGIETIRTTGEHLLALINDILDLSRIEAQHTELLPAPLELAPFLRSVIDVLRAKADEKHLVLALSADRNLPAVVLADERRLRQVLLNLLANAVRFTDQGQVSLCVTDEGRDGPCALVRIDVRDTGVGIQPEDLPIIFEPFRQVGEAKRREGGTGLGLTVARALVSAMGGNIGVTSEPGHGTQFSFRLRLPLAHTGHRTVPMPSIPVHQAQRRLRVLVVDDAADNRAMFVDFLNASGFDSESAEDGPQGMDKVRSFRPDLVVMDSVMPGMSGLKATRMLRAHPAYAHLPIIAVSADATEQHRQACVEAGATMCLSKPVQLDRLAAVIRQLLQSAPRVRSCA